MIYYHTAMAGGWTPSPKHRFLKNWANKKSALPPPPPRINRLAESPLFFLKNRKKCFSPPPVYSPAGWVATKYDLRNCPPSCLRLDSLLVIVFHIVLSSKIILYFEKGNINIRINRIQISTIYIVYLDLNCLVVPIYTNFAHFL